MPRVGYPHHLPPSQRVYGIANPEMMSPPPSDSGSESDNVYSVSRHYDGQVVYSFRNPAYRTFRPQQQECYVVNEDNTSDKRALRRHQRPRRPRQLRNRSQVHLNTVNNSPKRVSASKEANKALCLADRSKSVH